MNNHEKEEIKRLSSKYKPISAWGYVGYSILFSLPLIGFVLLIVFSCIDNNINLRSYARSHLCALLLVLIIFVIAVVIGLVSGQLPQLLESLRQAGQQG